MEVIYHPLAWRDVVEILRYYRKVSDRLADEFHDELRSLLDVAAGNPFRFPSTDRGFRRANLSRFPFHVLYEVRSDVIRVMLVRHHKRNPQFGMKRE